MKRWNLSFIVVCFEVLRLLSGQAAYAQDLTRLGGDLTTDLPGRFALQLPAPNVVSQARRIQQLSGFSTFHRIVLASEGLGPTFVNRSCGGCHVDNGRGPVGFPRGVFEGSPMIVKIALPKLKRDGSPQEVPGLGFQLQNHSLKRDERFRVSLRWRTHRGKYPDGTRYSLRSPRLGFSARGYTHRTVRNSLRMSPLIIGAGLVEAIPEEAILERADPGDANRDGISGRPNFVPNRRTGSLAIGRFGFKAAHPTVEQQSAAALFFDMGVTSELFKKQDGDVELPNEELDRLSVYQTIAGVPQARSLASPEVAAGQALFVSTGCEDCHRMTYTTGSASHPELENQVIHPFSDFLLHDMGAGLADRKPEGEAKGFEWRTTPLWGLGFSSTVSKVRPRYLHDGRARSIEEAILWHDGEARSSRERFMALSKNERSQLLSFLNAL
jgi:CxxC motif-containing protein (DUF1111 family)